MTTSEKNQKRECRFVVHVPTKDPEISDVHLIKEVVHHEDGTIEPKIRILKDYQRPVYITKPNSRTYEQKKEWEHVSKLNKYDCTQSQLRNKIAQLLNKSWSRETQRELQNSPYVYGTDIPATNYIKYRYAKKFPGLESLWSVCAYDLETRVDTDAGEILMASACYKNQSKVWVDGSFINGHPDPQLKYKQMQDIYLANYKNKYEFELIVCEDELDVIKKSFAQLHAWKPDFVSIWNMDFDIPKITQRLKVYNIDPKHLFSDPIVPPMYRYFRYKRGSDRMVTASGNHKPKSPSSQWHTVYCTSSFYIIDQMCSYKLLRLSDPEEPSYSLDAILTKTIGATKLKIDGTEKYSGKEWHAHMQTNLKFEYMAYNAFDTVSMIEMELVTTDLQFKLPSSVGYSSFDIADSLPKKIHADLHFEYIEQGFISGTVGKVEDEADDTVTEDEYDENGEPLEPEEDLTETLGLKGWILTLASYLSALGLPVISEDPNLPSGFRYMVFDSDSVSAYPTATSAANVSKETTVYELIRVIGIEEETFKMQNLNSVLGHSNAIEYCTKMYGLPKPDELLDLI